MCRPLFIYTSGRQVRSVLAAAARLGRHLAIDASDVTTVDSVECERHGTMDMERLGALGPDGGGCRGGVYQPLPGQVGRRARAASGRPSRGLHGLPQPRTGESPYVREVNPFTMLYLEAVRSPREQLAPLALLNIRLKYCR